jgi:catechol 2,3-dioxygenase-like lactoylglutathione lyase family enzyme
MKIKLGTVGHFGLAVRDPRKSSTWWRALFDLEVMFEGDDYIGLTNENVTIVLLRGVPRPRTIEHISFHLQNMKELRQALEVLKRRRVDIEDPGSEIGPEAPGSPNMGLWFHDLDGYRWELSVQARGRTKRSGGLEKE